MSTDARINRFIRNFLFLNTFIKVSYIKLYNCVDLSSKQWLTVTTVERSVTDQSNTSN